MNLNTLKDFRQQVYACMERRADALFGLCDGLLSEPQARSLPELSHSPFFDHTWSSVYAALADGKVNLQELRGLCVRSALAELPTDALVWVAVDGTSVARLEAETSEDRGAIHVSNLPLCDKPISIGWSFSVVGGFRTSQVVGRRCWRFNGSAPIRRPLKWRSSNCGCSSRSLESGR